jgi:hypothetical protein
MDDDEVNVEPVETTKKARRPVEGNLVHRTCTDKLEIDPF